MGKTKSALKHKSNGSSGQSYCSVDVCVTVARRRSKSKASGTHKAKQKVCH